MIRTTVLSPPSLKALRHPIVTLLPEDTRPAAEANLRVDGDFFMAQHRHLVEAKGKPGIRRALTDLQE